VRGQPALERGETIHNWVFKVRLAANHTIKNRLGITASREIRAKQ
jgi:hypothetical protein